LSRAFVAVVPPEEVLRAVDVVATAVADGLPRSARRAPREQWHVTLQFLGDDVDLGAVAAALAPLALGPGEVRLGGLGAFPNERRARIVWLGVAEGAPWLVQAAVSVGALLQPLGHDPDPRPFHGHLTLARLRAPCDLRSVVAAVDATAGPPWRVEEIVLFESVAGPRGAQHRPHARFPLG
jgi:2'-5' RNA ligase